MKSLTDWNKRPDLQRELDAFLKSECWTFADEVIRGLYPRLLRGTTIDAVNAHIELGRLNGFLDYRALLELMRKEITMPGGTDLTPDFETP